jgi:hypothetical protein
VSFLGILHPCCSLRTRAIVVDKIRWGRSGHMKQSDFLAEIPADMIVLEEKSSRHSRIPAHKV